MVGGRSRQVGDGQIHCAERAWVLRVSLVDIGRVWAEERGRERGTETEREEARGGQRQKPLFKKKKTFGI